MCTPSGLFASIPFPRSLPFIVPPGVGVITLHPGALPQFAGPVANVFLLHLFQGLSKVVRIQKTDKSIAFGLVGSLVPDNLQA